MPLDRAKVSGIIGLAAKFTAAKVGCFMTIDDVIQELVDINDWEHQLRGEYIYGDKFIPTVNGEYQYAIKLREACIEIQKRNGWHVEIYLWALTDDQLTTVKNIYRRVMERQLERF